MEFFRDELAKILVPMGRPLAALKVNPNLISITGILFGILAAYCFVSGALLWGLVFFSLTATADALDGVVARLRHMDSPFGAFFDNFCSAYADSAVFGGLIVAGLCSPFWGIAALSGILGRMLSYRLPSAMIRDAAEGNSYGIGGKTDRIIIITVGAIFGHIAESVIVVTFLTQAVTVYRTIYCYRLLSVAEADRTQSR